MKKFLVILMLFPCAFNARAQELSAQIAETAYLYDIETLARKADSLRAGFRFKEAADILDQISYLCDEGSRESFLMQAEGCRLALELSQRVLLPRVISRQCFSGSDYFLYYPIPDGSWRPCEIIYENRDGSRTGAGNEGYFLFRDARDTLHLSRDQYERELFPYTDGQSLYFASSLLPGIGGLDIFRCDWDESKGEWGEPQNLGFPFNSPDDDFLYIPQADGKNTVFASNRGCSRDSVCLYVLEDPKSADLAGKDADLEKICSLQADSGLSDLDTRPATGSALQERNREHLEAYRLKVEEIHTIRDSLSRFNGSLEQKTELNGKLHDAEDALSRIEMYFLSNDAVQELEQSRREAELQVISSDGSYTFTRKAPGKHLVLILAL